MKKRNLAFITALVMTLSVFSTNVLAGDTMLPTGKATWGENQFTTHGYRIVDIENWSPETDPQAESLRASIPLQQRNEPFTATQANPNLSSKTQFFNLIGDYDIYFMGATPYNNEFSNYLYNFWQYTDYHGGWHGMATVDVPKELYDPEEEWWLRAFEIGILDIPNPAYTNAAHKNGVKSVGCLYIPRTGQPYELLLKQREDGTFPVAEKLIEMKEYFGFDGYFINQETAIKPEHIETYKAFTKTLVDAGVYTQWYDVVNDEDGKMSYQPSLISSHSSFVRDDEKGGLVNNSIFMNYNWNSPDGWNNGDSTDQGYILETVEEAKRRGVDPYETVFTGVEAGLGSFGGSHNSTRNMDVILDKETGNPLTSIATLGGNFVQTALDEHLGDPARYLRGDDDHQWMIAERERMWYTGVKIDPKNTEEQKGYTRPDVGVPDASEWTGISRYIAERSVIDGTTFTTNFNTGHGMDYFVDGEVSNEEEWSNINLQDILPTWQWWIDTTGSALQVDFDYGNTVEKGDKFTYEQIGAYKGGSSLVINGRLDADNFLRLYKTDLEVTDTTIASITYSKPSENDHSLLELGLIFKDAPEKVEYITIPGTHLKTNEFVTSNVDLSDYAGREIALIGFNFKPSKGVIEDYQINIGELKITDNQDYTPDVAQGFELEAVYNTGEAVVTWDMADYNEVKEYHVYAELKDGKNIFLGGLYGDRLYIKNLDQDVSKLKLIALGQDKSESKPAEIELSYKDYLKEVIVEEKVEGLQVDWKNPQGEYEAIKLELSFTDGRTDTYTKVVPKDTTSTLIEVPAKDGDRYLLKVSTIDSDGNYLNTISATGKMRDVYSEPFDGKYTVSGDKLIIDTPSSNDWWHMYVKIDGKTVHPKQQFDGQTIDYFIRGYHGFDDLDMPRDNAIISVVLEDYVGNFSQPVEFKFSK